MDNTQLINTLKMQLRDLNLSEDIKNMFYDLGYTHVIHLMPIVSELNKGTEYVNLYGEVCQEILEEFKRLGLLIDNTTIPISKQLEDKITQETENTDEYIIFSLLHKSATENSKVTFSCKYLQYYIIFKDSQASKINLSSSVVIYSKYIDTLKEMGIYSYLTETSFKATSYGAVTITLEPINEEAIPLLTGYAKIKAY